MTVVDDRIAMAVENTEHLDDWFESLERMPVPEGYKVEIVEGTVFMSPQRSMHWEIIRRIVRALEDTFGMHVKVFSDVRIDFPGHLNGFCARRGQAPRRRDAGRSRALEVRGRRVRRRGDLQGHRPQ